MKETFETYIFDLDGTLLNTLDDLAASVNHALRELNLKTHSTDDIRRFLGNGSRKLIERAVEGGAQNPLVDEVEQKFRAHYLVHSLDTTQPYPGVIQMLDELRRRNKKIAVVSNKFYAATQQLCRHFFAQQVEVAIGERADIRKKPAPDTVLEALSQLHADKSSAVYVGDSEVDIETARNAGLPCISVLWGFRDRPFLEEHGATCFVERPEQTITLWNNDFLLVLDINSFRQILQFCSDEPPVNGVDALVGNRRLSRDGVDACHVIIEIVDILETDDTAVFLDVCQCLVKLGSFVNLEVREVECVIKFRRVSRSRERVASMLAVVVSLSGFAVCSCCP